MKSAQTIHRSVKIYGTRLDHNQTTHSGKQLPFKNEKKERNILNQKMVRTQTTYSDHLNVEYKNTHSIMGYLYKGKIFFDLNILLT